MSRKNIRVFIPASAVLFASAAALFVVGVSVAAFEYVDDHAERLLAQREATIAEEELKLLEDVYQDEGRDGVIRAVARRAALPSDNLGIVAIADQQGNILVGNVDWPKSLKIDGKWRGISTVSDSEEPVNGYARAITLGDGTRVLVGRNFAYSETLRASLSNAMFAALAVLLAATLGLGIWLNRYVLTRIDAIASTTRRISMNNLSERIPVGTANTEFEHLGVTLNEMLDRNQALIEQMRLMTDAISHDLRLPLQRVRSNLNMAMESSEPDKLKAGITQAIEDADAALDTFNSLLDIARAEAGVGKEAFAAVEISSLIADVVELFEPLAEEKEQKLEVCVTPANVWGQSMLLKQMFGNLLHNAIKYTPTHGKISVRLAREEPGKICLVVEDNGPGVPEVDRGQVAQPFGRLSRDQGSEGKGLGLALAAAFAKLHDGNVRLSDANPGLRVTVTLPEFVEQALKTQSELI
ncbi:MAG: HAMP domain-containing sensor histidine kinase [Micropepsaceae bacterium]